MDEEWRKIPDAHPYSVSNLGRVRFDGITIERNDKLGRRGRVTYKPRVRKTSKGDSEHYPSISLWVNGKHLSFTVHGLVLRAFVGPCPEGMEARHLNGDRSDARLENLRYGTRAENMGDRGAHGNHLRGERANGSKLTSPDVIKIRELASSGVPQIDLAKRYGVGAMTISRIVRRQRWVHI